MRYWSPKSSSRFHCRLKRFIEQLKWIAPFRWLVCSYQSLSTVGLCGQSFVLSILGLIASINGKWLGAPSLEFPNCIEWKWYVEKACRILPCFLLLFKRSFNSLLKLQNKHVCSEFVMWLFLFLGHWGNGKLLKELFPPTFFKHIHLSTISLPLVV